MSVAEATRFDMLKKAGHRRDVPDIALQSTKDFGTL
jgi:hypothetical protein